MEKSKVLIQFLVIFRQFGDVLSFLYARRLRGYTATVLIYFLQLGRKSSKKSSGILHINTVAVFREYVVYIQSQALRVEERFGENWF